MNSDTAQVQSPSSLKFESNFFETTAILGRLQNKSLPFCVKYG